MATTPPTHGRSDYELRQRGKRKSYRVHSSSSDESNAPKQQVAPTKRARTEEDRTTVPPRKRRSTRVPVTAEETAIFVGSSSVQGGLNFVQHAALDFPARTEEERTTVPPKKRSSTRVPVTAEETVIVVGSSSVQGGLNLGQRAALDFPLKISISIHFQNPIESFHWLIARDYSVPLLSNPLQSWIHPSFRLPQSLFAAKGAEESNFVQRRYAAWQEAFGSLYELFCKKHMNLFYITSPPVMMFMSDFQRSQHVYVCHSKKELRDYLQKDDIKFTMPFGSGENEDETSYKSMIAIEGDDLVRCFYNFVLKFRSNIWDNLEVPTLMAPMAFVNSTFSLPNVTYSRFNQMIKLTDVLLPPWVVLPVCLTVASERKSFDVSFETDPNSTQLNAALGAVMQSMNSEDANAEVVFPLGKSEATVNHSLQFKILNALKYDGSFVASLSNH